MVLKGRLIAYKSGPRHRNENIIHQAFLRTIIDSSEKPLFPEYHLLKQKLPATLTNLTPKNVSERDAVYILFTSGTTGQPKGVPITLSNLTGYCSF